MRKRKLKDWMGADWTIGWVEEDDSRLPDGAAGCIRGRNNEILIAEGDTNQMLHVIFHEVAHKALGHLEFSDTEKEELLVDMVAYTYLSFLRKMGVDLSPLVE